MIGLSHLCLNFESTNWIFGNKIRIYQLLTMHRAKKGLVITEHYSFDTDLHHVTSRILDPTDVIFLTLDLLGDHQWPSSSFFAACGLSWHSNSRIRLHDSFFFFFFFYDVLFTFFIFIVKLEDFSFSFACFTKIKRSLKVTFFLRDCHPLICIYSQSHLLLPPTYPCWLPNINIDFFFNITWWMRKPSSSISD